jgi:hypothetical protein
MSDLKLDVDQAGELKAGFRRTRGSNGIEWSNEDIKKLSEGNHLGLVLDYLHGRAKIVPVVQQGSELSEEEVTSFLKKLTASGPLILDAVDGSEILADANEVFGWIDSNFKSYGADEKGSATEMTPVDVHEMAKDGEFVQLFSSLSADLNKLCLSQHQIKNFVVKHRDWLRTEGYGTFFLFKSKSNFFVADVRFDSGDSLGVDVHELGFGYRWSAEGRHRFVVPQLAEAQ